MESGERSASAAGPFSEDPSIREPEELWDFDSLSDASSSDADSSDADTDSNADRNGLAEEEPERAELDREVEVEQPQPPPSPEPDPIEAVQTLQPATEEPLDAPIWQRTRARQPLTDVTIEELDALLQDEPLDSDQEEEDEQYREFLRVLQGDGGAEGEELPEDDDDRDFVLDWDELMALGEEEAPEPTAAQSFLQTRNARFQRFSPEPQQPGVQWVPQLGDLPTPNTGPGGPVVLPLDSTAGALAQNGPVVSFCQQAERAPRGAAGAPAQAQGQAGEAQWQAAQGSLTADQTRAAASQLAQPMRRHPLRTTAAACREALMRTFEALDEDGVRTQDAQEPQAGAQAAPQAGGGAAGEIASEPGQAEPSKQPRQPKTLWKRNRQNPLTREQLNQRRRERHASNPDGPRPQRAERPTQSAIAAQQRKKARSPNTGQVPSNVLPEDLNSWYIATPGWSCVQLGHLRKQIAQHLQLLVTLNAMLASSTEHLHHEALDAVRLLLHHMLMFCHYAMQHKETQRTPLVPKDVLQEAASMAYVPQTGRPVRSLLDLPIVSALPAYISDMAQIPVPKPPPYVPPAAQTNGEAPDAARSGEGAAGQAASAAGGRKGPGNAKSQRIAAMKRPIELSPAVQRVFAAHCVRHLDPRMLPKRVPLKDTAWTSGEKELLHLGIRRLGNDCVKIQQCLLPGRLTPHVYARMQEAMANTPGAEPPLSQAEFDVIKAAKAKSKGKDKWDHIAALLPDRAPGTLHKLFQDAVYEVGLQKHEAAKQRAAAKQQDLGGSLLGGPDKGPFDDLVASVLRYWAGAAQPTASTSVVPPPSWGFPQPLPGAELRAQRPLGPQRQLAAPKPTSEAPIWQSQHLVPGHATVQQQPAGPRVMAPQQPARMQPMATQQPAVSQQSLGQRPQVPVGQLGMATPLAVQLHSYQRQGPPQLAGLAPSQPVRAAGGQRALQSAVAPHPSLQMPASSLLQAAPGQTQPHQARPATQPEPAGPLAGGDNSKSARGPAPAQHPQQPSTSTAMLAHSAGAALQRPAIGAHQPVPAVHIQEPRHSSGVKPPAAIAVPASIANRQGPQPDGAPGGEQAGPSRPGGASGDEARGSSECPVGSQSADVGDRPAETPRKTRLHRKKNPPQLLSRPLKPLAMKPIAPGLPPPRQPAVPRGLSGPGLPSSVPTTGASQDQRVRAPTLAAPRPTIAQPPTQSQPSERPVQDVQGYARQQEQERPASGQASNAEQFPGMVPSLRTLNSISGPSRLTGSPENPGRAKRPRADQPEEEGPAWLPLSPTSRKQMTAR